ncbi:MAG TPA: apolipoprotein N-acyltransferase [Caulobacteraceae bacterium]|jgi:apolipoprotein N-acyltransferase|nr:apolipoprotein N-acyltransferase [Caulobacteraceae bacterium]
MNQAWSRRLGGPAALVEPARPGGRRSLRVGPRALAFLAGVVSAFAAPPWGFVPGLLAYGVVFRLVDGARTDPRPLRAGFARGWFAGAGYFLVSLWWLYEPFQVDAREQGWMAPFAVVLVSMFMALFWGAAAAAYRRLAGPWPLRALAFAACLTLAEWLRGHLLTGFPWDLPGEAWRAGSPLSQTAALVGAYGLTWITIGAMACIFVAFEGRAGAALALSALVALAGLDEWGRHRLAEPTSPLPGAALIRIVQPDVKQETKYDPAVFAGIVGRYVVLTQRSAPRTPDLVLWPEGALPGPFEELLAPGAWTREEIAGALQPGEALMFGAYRFGASVKGREIAFNALMAVRKNPTGGLTPLAGYDKFRLVPFGEFMPLDSVASRLGVKQMVHVGEGFTAGPPPQPRRLPGLPGVQPLICYEALFPGFTRSGARRSGWRPDWIANLSNDAWFGHGIGPEQHLNLASYRAIEEGLPMARATPTGVSAMIDAHGRVTARLGEGASGVIDALLPRPLPPTPYERFGDAAALLLCGLGILAGLAGLANRARRAA